MKKLLAALIACAFATVAIAQGTMTDDKKKADAAKPYSPTPPAAAPAAAPAKDAAPMKKDAMATTAPAAKSTKDMTADEKKAAKAAKKKARADKQVEDIKADTKKP
ncbi:MAG: hypothetical protein H7X75_05850 [Burkholderiaceae bacterium]|nr:hypothetical protein [Burkholderiaceae bacterium]